MNPGTSGVRELLVHDAVVVAILSLGGVNLQSQLIISRNVSPHDTVFNSLESCGRVCTCRIGALKQGG